MNKIIEFINNKNKLISFICFAAWGLLVLKFATLTEYNTDELWAWDIAADLNFYDITRLMHYEGHSFLWYIILKPFTYLASIFPNIYPDILKIINLFFIASAMFLLWFFSPINLPIKILISLSSPFLILYPSLARPYSLLVLLLFAIAILYKDRLKHPLIYSSLLFLTTHTGINGTIATTIFGGFFIYDLYIEQKENLKTEKFIIPVSVIISAFLMLLIEWIPIYPALYVQECAHLERIKEFLVHTTYSKFSAIICVLVYGLITQIVLLINIINLKSRRYLIYLLFVINATIGFFLLFGPAGNYHLYFLYVYIIVLYWIMKANNIEFNQNKPAYISSTIYLALLSLIYISPYREPAFWFSPKMQYKYSSEQLCEIIPKGSRIYLDLEFAQDLIPYLKNKYELLTHYGDPIPSLDAYKSLYQYLPFYPQDLYIKPNKANYYIIAKQYFDMRQEINASDITEIFETNENCEDIQGKYYLCNLTKE